MAIEQMSEVESTEMLLNPSGWHFPGQGYTPPSDLPVSANTTTIPARWDGRIAYGVSMLGSPPLVSITLMVHYFTRFAFAQAWLSLLVYLSLAVVAPLLHLVKLVRRGWVTDIDVQLRKQRAGPLLYTLLCSGIAFVILAWMRVPQQLLAILVGQLAMLLAVFLITLRWKISVHCTAFASAATFAWGLLHIPWLWLLGVPLIIWSRLRLQRHTPLQTLAGTLLGTSVSLVVLILGG